ncbi:hypothetical protein OESDEN_18002, partial [Oesophagostomum dentatum]
MNMNTVEEPYSSLGYGDNVPYIQPDGINPYDDKTSPFSSQSRSVGHPPVRPANWAALPTRVIRSAPVPITFSGTSSAQTVSVKPANLGVNNNPVVTNDHFQRQGTVQISQPNLLWEVRRNKITNRSGFAKSGRSGRGMSSGPPGQQP